MNAKEPKMTEYDLDNLRYILGVYKYNKAEWGYRNYFFTEENGDDYPSMLKLEKAGYVKQNPKRYEGGGMIFNATEKAFKLFKFTQEQTDRALGRSGK